MSVEPEVTLPDPVTEVTPPTEPTVTETITSLVAAAAVESPAEVEPVAETVPLTITDLVIPEGYEVSDDLKTSFVDILNNPELSLADRANALLTLQTQALTMASEMSSQVWTTEQTEWRNEVTADPTLGGANLPSTLASVGKLVTEFGSPELSAVFDKTGAGNNIHIIRFLHNLSTKLTEGSYAAGSPAAESGSAASRMFPSMKG